MLLVLLSLVLGSPLFVQAPLLITARLVGLGLAGGVFARGFPTLRRIALLGEAWRSSFPGQVDGLRFGDAAELVLEVLAAMAVAQVGFVQPWSRGDAGGLGELDGAFAEPGGRVEQSNAVARFGISA